VERLHEIGLWLKQNGESIYGTRGGPWLPGDYGVSTHKGKTVYLHILNVPAKGSLELPNLPARILKMSDMAGHPVAYSQGNEKISVQLQTATQDVVDQIIKIELAEPWSTDAVVPVEADKGWFHPEAAFGVKQ